MKTGTGYIGLILFILTCSFTMDGQNFIGLHKNEIAGMLKKVNPQFKLDNSAVNHTYNYLKFVDKVSEQTILFFLSDQDECTFVRWMADYANLSDLTSMLNQNYRKIGPNSWSYTDKGKKYSVTLVEEDWYFTLSFRKN
jgi:hypothetical protein